MTLRPIALHLDLVLQRLALRSHPSLASVDSFHITLPPSDLVLAACAEMIDRAAIRVMERLWLSGGDPLGEADRERQRSALDLYSSEQLLKEPAAFFPQPGAPSVTIAKRRKIRGGFVERGSWPSSYRTWDPTYQTEYDRFEENGVACFEHHRHARSGAPTVICIPSWATGSYAFLRTAFQISRLFRLGFDVAICMLPFHGPRRPRSARFDGQHFPGTSVQRTNEGFGQLVFDVRALVRYLEEKGSGPIGVIGMSLGGYASALLASIEPKLRFSVPMIPLVAWADFLWKHGERHPKRKEAEANGISLEHLRKAYAIHGPLQRAPLVPRDGRMIIAGGSDRVCTPDHVALLWEHWDKPQIHFFIGGHIAPFGRGETFDALERFLTRFVR